MNPPEEDGDSLLPRESFADRVQRKILGERRDVNDPHALHKISLIAFLAWVGLGADGLSSSAYGPEEAFRGDRGGLQRPADHARAARVRHSSFFR